MTWLLYFYSDSWNKSLNIPLTPKCCLGTSGPCLAAQALGSGCLFQQQNNLMGFFFFYCYFIDCIDKSETSDRLTNTVS